MNAERERLAREVSRTEHWYRWGPYLAERQWGTVREDYSGDGTAWDYFPHDHARSPAHEGRRPALACYSDIFALTESTRFEPPGTAFAFDAAGRDRGLELSGKMLDTDYAADILVMLAHLDTRVFASAVLLFRSRFGATAGRAS